jgi:hypothetical protein
MKPGTRSVSTLTILALSGLALFGLGCATWQPIQREKIAATLHDSKPDYARVEAGSTVLIVRHPEVRADTLRGTVREGNDVPVVIPLAMVDSLSLYRSERSSRAAPLIGVAIPFLLMTVLLLGYHQPGIR